MTDALNGTSYDVPFYSLLRHGIDTRETFLVRGRVLLTDRFSERETSHWA